MSEFTVTKYAAYVPISVEMLFNQPREGVVWDGVQIVEPWPLWLLKEWLKRGHGLGREVLSRRWPRPTRVQLRQERIDHSAWLKSLDEEE